MVTMINEMLVEEMKRLLKVFPHGVIIESGTHLQQRKIQFVNENFKQTIKDINSQIDSLRLVEVSVEQLNKNTDGLVKDTLLHLLDLQVDKLGAENIFETPKVSVNCVSQCVEDEEGKGHELIDEDEPAEMNMRTFNIKSINVHWKGNPSCMHIFIDTTDIVKLEEATNNIKCQKIMFASASHEFRTPLNAIINSYSFIGDSTKILLKRLEQDRHNQGDKIIRPQLDRINKFVKMGHNSSILLMALIEDILDLSKMEAGTFSMLMSDFKVDQLITEVADVFEIQCEHKKLAFDIDVDQQLSGLTIQSDFGRLKQILLNLMSNAFKFTFSGSITIRVKKATENDVPFVLFSVADTGIGIKEEEQSKLFSLFGTAPSEDGLNPHGCGIGLTVSKKYLERLGGRISVESKYGVGTTVKLIVPLKEIKSIEVYNDSSTILGKYLLFLIYRLFIRYYNEFGKHLFMNICFKRTEKLG